jgi:hypothetical protein
VTNDEKKAEEVRRERKEKSRVSESKTIKPRIPCD